MKTPWTSPLMERLSDQTEFRNEPASNQINVEFTETVEKDINDFEPESVIDNNFNPDPITDEIDNQEIKPVKTHEEFRREAEGIISLIDAGQTVFLPRLYLKDFTSIEIAICKQIEKDSLKKGYDVPDEYVTLFSAYKQVNELIDDIPYSESEKLMLIDPLTEILEKYNTSISPEWRLIAAIIAVSFPRLLPLFRR